jgi:endonuclease YncB( thermonuclease family)
LAVAVATSALLSGASTAGGGGAEKGKVVRIVDGDTVAVDIWGDGTTTPVVIRNAGIQAMEVGQCHSRDATDSMYELAMGAVVSLTSKSPDSYSLGRPIRFVDVPTRTTVIDTALEMIKRGEALWLVMPPEDGRGRTYHLAMEKAAAAKVGPLWDNDHCGYGPSQGAKLKLWVNYDGDGDDGKYPNSEYIRVLNKGSYAVSVGGWRLRSAGPDVYTIPAGVSIPAGGTLTLRMGKGTNTASTLFWGLTSAKFPNLYPPPGSVGSGGYLFDPHGDIRAHATYPCIYRCSDPAIGKVSLRPHYDAPGDDMQNPNGEYVDVTNTSSSAVDLSYRVVQVGGSTIEFGKGSVLPALGSRIRVYVGKGATTKTVKYWGKTGAIMVNSGGSAELRTTEGFRIACASWGSGSC